MSPKSQKGQQPRQRKHAIAKVQRSVKRPHNKARALKNPNRRSGRKARQIHKKKLAAMAVTNPDSKRNKEAESDLSYLPPPYKMHPRDANDGADRSRLISFMLQVEALRKKYEQNTQPETRSRDFLREVAKAATWLVMDAVSGIRTAAKHVWPN